MQIFSIVGALKKTKARSNRTASRVTWLVSGKMPADEIEQRLSIAIPERRSYHTAASFALEHVGHLPTIEPFETQGWRFKIVDLDGHGIDKILAFRVPSGPLASCAAVTYVLARSRSGDEPRPRGRRCDPRGPADDPRSSVVAPWNKYQQASPEQSKDFP